MKSLLLFFLILFLSGCADKAVKLSSVNKWQPIELKVGEEFQYQLLDVDKEILFMNLTISQGKENKLRGQWLINRDNKMILTKQLDAFPEKFLSTSKTVLIIEKQAQPILNTLLMSWWSKIEYIRWQVGYKRAFLMEMMAAFMLEVISECEVIGIKGYQVQLKLGQIIMAEACLSPAITLPLSVKRFYFNGGGISYEAKLIHYQR